MPPTVDSNSLVQQIIRAENLTPTSVRTTRRGDNEAHAKREIEALFAEKFPCLISRPDLYVLSFKRSQYVNKLGLLNLETLQQFLLYIPPTVNGHARRDFTSIGWTSTNFRMMYGIENPRIGSH